MSELYISSSEILKEIVRYLHILLKARKYMIYQNSYFEIEREDFRYEITQLNKEVKHEISLIKRELNIKKISFDYV